MYGYTITNEDKARASALAPKAERQRDAILWVAFGDIGSRAAAFGSVPTESLLDQIETLCAECREVLATSKRQSPVQAARLH